MKAGGFANVNEFAQLIFCLCVFGEITNANDEIYIFLDR